ncbi:MAG: hypothetical protein PHP42_14000 [Bacteroidota bacterium]|nr:hypothetical protein [Bacteroidota bacterium]
MLNEDKLRETLHDIIEGKIVKRSKHELVFNGTNVSDIFIEELTKKNFLPMTVNHIKIEKGERVPAFLIEDRTAYFGWVFWEKFTELRLRKLFGTVLRNTKGDWLIQLSSNSTTMIYANIVLKIEMDIDRPFEWL